MSFVGNNMACIQRKNPKTSFANGSIAFYHKMLETFPCKSSNTLCILSSNSLAMGFVVRRAAVRASCINLHELEQSC